MQRGRLAVFLLVALLLLIVGGAVVSMVVMIRGGDRGDLEEGSVLVLPISGALPEQPDPDEPLPGLGQHRISILEIDSALRKAAADDRVGSVLVRPGALLTGFGKVQELRDIIQRFSVDSGKPVICWMESVGNKEYLLATACDEIYMAPEGFFLVNGLRLGVTFLKGTFDKLGVEAEFTRSGKYKSAVEAYTSTEMSAPFREMLESMADSLHGDFVAAISESRDLSPERVQALIDDPPLTAGAAWRAGLIDGLYYRDQLMARLVGEEPASYDPYALPHRVGDDDDSAEPLRAPEAVAADDDDSAKGSAPSGEAAEDPRLISFKEYRKVSPSSLGLGKGPKVAVVFCEGQITSGKSNPGGGLGSASMGSDTIAKAIRTARKDDAVKAIVLRVDSPGGSGLASDIIWREVELARTVNHKPVVVSMSDYAASGGYYIAMNADAIVAQPGTLTGSIGVFAGKYNLAGLYEKVGLTTDSVERGEMAGIFSADQGLGEEGLAKLQEFTDEFYDVFIAKVGLGREMTPDEVHALAQGRVWTGRQALDEGLIDALGSFRTALQIAKEKANIEGEASLVLYPKQATFLEQLLGQDVDTTRSQALLGAMDRFVPGGRGLPRNANTEAARALLGAAPFFADGVPVLIAPYHVGAW